MSELTLEQTATKYGENNGEQGIMEPLSSAFKAGAEWQKNRFAKLLSLAKQAANDCEGEGNMQMAEDLRNEIDILESE